MALQIVLLKFNLKELIQLQLRFVADIRYQWFYIFNYMQLITEIFTQTVLINLHYFVTMPTLMKVWLVPRVFYQ